MDGQPFNTRRPQGDRDHHPSVLAEGYRAILNAGVHHEYTLEEKQERVAMWRAAFPDRRKAPDEAIATDE